MMPLNQFARGQKRKLVAYLTAGFPDSALFVDVCAAAAEAGIDALEIGVPFSDPIADGPTIQYSSQIALDNGVISLQKVADLTRTVADTVDTPLIWMGYLNPFLFGGLSNTLRLAADSGVQGLIVPDLPLEEATEFREVAQAAGGLSWIPLLASTTRDERAATMLSQASGFAYYVSVKGVTGVRTAYPDGWHEPLTHIRNLGGAPMLVGFGVSNRDLAIECATYADGVIVGSKLIDIIRETGNDAPQAVNQFLSELRSGLDSLPALP